MHGASLYTDARPLVYMLLKIAIVAEGVGQRACAARIVKTTLARYGIYIALKLSHVVRIATMVAALAEQHGIGRGAPHIGLNSLHSIAKYIGAQPSVALGGRGLGGR